MPKEYETSQNHERSTAYDSPIEEWMAKNSVEAITPRLEQAELGYSDNEGRHPEYGYSYSWLTSSSYNIINKARQRAQIALGVHEIGDLEALNLLKNKKTEETEWAQVFGAAELSPENTIKALQSYVPWIETVKPWYGGSDNSSYLISPRHLTPIINAAVAKAIKANPALEDQAMEGYEDLLSRAKQEVASKHSGPYTNMLKKTEEALGTLARGDELSRFYYSDEEAMLKLMVKLTDRKIIDRDSWYAYGVGSSNTLPAIGFLEQLSNVIDSYDKSSGPHGSHHEKYYSDACSFAAKIIHSFTTDDRRNTHNASVITEMLERTKTEQSQPFSPADFIRVANVISRYMNGHADSNLPPLERTKPDNLPLAVLRLASVTRSKSDDAEIADQLEYEETIYLDILTYMIGEAVKLHAEWFLDRLIKSTEDYKALLPRTYKGRGAAMKRSSSAWNRWRPGYGKLT